MLDFFGVLCYDSASQHMLLKADQLYSTMNCVVSRTTHCLQA